MFVLLAIQYADSPQEFEKGGQSTQNLSLTPQQCLELGEKLTKAGKHLLENQPGKSSH
jgi:hypothetical protein